MLYYANSRVQDLPASTAFVKWDQFYAGLALKVARREMIRLRGWEAAPQYDQNVQVLVAAVAADRCGLFSVRPDVQDQDWPRFACFTNWAFRLNEYSFNSLLNDIGSSNCRWCDAVIQVLDAQCCDQSHCSQSIVARDPCLQGTGRVSDMTVVLGTPHNFQLCGQAAQLPATWDEFVTANNLLAWLGYDVPTQQYKVQQWPYKSPSGQPLPPPFETVSYGEEADKVPWTWLAAAGAAIGLSLLVFWGDE